MKDQAYPDRELIKEISILKQRIRELEQSEAKRQSASEELRKSERFFRAITQHSSDIIFVVDRQGIITYASPSVERFLGYRPDDLIGTSSLDLILSDDQPKAVEDFSKALLTRDTAIPNVFRIRHREGGERLLEGLGKNLLDDPVVAGFVMNARDVTERRKAEEALWKREEQYRQLVEKATDIVFRTDGSGNITLVNPSMVRATGYREEEMIGRQYTMLIRPDMREPAMKFFGRQFVKNIQNTYSEFPMITKEGREVWVGQNTQLIFEGPSVTGFQVVARDVTERKQMEEALRESQAFYLSLVEQLPAGVVRKDPEGRYVFVSPWFCRLKGLKVEDFVGKTSEELVANERAKPAPNEQMIRYAAEGAEHHARIMKTRKPLESVQEYTDDAGRKQFVHVVKTPVFNPEGKVIGTQGVFFDISEQKRMEEALRESENRYREMSMIDGLTRLYNSRHFYFQLKIELDRSNRYGQPLTLLMLDLDDFKTFNDSFGHVEGDHVLSRLGQVIKKCLRETDFACRYGGEEFTIILPITSSAEGVITAERIRTEFSKEPFRPEPDQEIYMTVSIGIAQYKPREAMKAFVHRVDQLMYQGKKNGKDKVCCDA
ncbi:MAG: sensor domain-containing diguanylate cyclase [Deltaproteobacteria bacterium]|nr:sensor domain-containing diguanylate cyclase [Deltaproteobacteria bacterium]